MSVFVVGDMACVSSCGWGHGPCQLLWLGAWSVSFIVVWGMVHAVFLWFGAWLVSFLVVGGMARVSYCGWGHGPCQFLWL